MVFVLKEIEIVESAGSTSWRRKCGTDVVRMSRRSTFEAQSEFRSASSPSCILLDLSEELIPAATPLDMAIEVLFFDEGEFTKGGVGRVARSRARIRRTIPGGVVPGGMRIS